MELVFAGKTGLTVLLVYGFLMLAIGVFVYLKDKNINNDMNEYYLGGGSLSLIVLFFTFFATTYSGNTAIGFAPKAYRLGFAWVQVIMVMTFVTAITVAFAPRLYKLAKKFKFLTPADWLEYRFGSPLLTISASLILMYALANYILAQIVAIGHGVAGLTGNTIPYEYGVVFFVLVMLTYSWLGGMRSVAYTDLVQGIIFFLGTIIFLIGTFYAFGDLTLSTDYLLQHETSKVLLPDTDTLRTWFSALILWGLGAAMYPQLIQRIYAAKDTKTIKRSLAKMLWAPIVIVLPIVIIGIIGIKAFPGLSKLESEELVGMMANYIASQNDFYFWAMILFFGGIISAIVSTADSALLSFSSFVSQDLYGRYINPKAPDSTKVLVGKLVGLLLVIVLVFIAWHPPGTLYEILIIKFELLIQVMPAILLAMYMPFLHKRAVWLGMISGTSLCLYLSIIGTKAYLGVLNGLWGLLLNLLICFIGSYLYKQKAKAS